MYTLGPWSLQRNLLWGWKFLLWPQPPQDFSVRGFEALFPYTGTMGCTAWLFPQLFLPVYRHTNVGPPALPVPASPSPPAATLLCVLSTPPTSLDECFFLTPWLLDFYTVWFSGSSSYFLFLNLLLSFFWLCKEAKCICLHLPLAGSPMTIFITGNFYFLIYVHSCINSVVMFVFSLQQDSQRRVIIQASILFLY